MGNVAFWCLCLRLRMRSFPSPTSLSAAGILLAGGMAFALYLLALCSDIFLQPVFGIPLTSFYPFGATAGDIALPPTVDGSSDTITLSIPFPFFASLHTTLYVSYRLVHGGLAVAE